LAHELLLKQRGDAPVKTNVQSSPVRCQRRAQGFTLTEVLVAVFSIAIVFVTLYLSITQSFAIIQVARENLRATQIIEEKMETIRLYTWEQINTSGFVPSTFTTPFYSVGTNTSGLTYTGTLTIGAADLSGVTYNDDLRLVTVQLSWNSGGINRNRAASTLVTRYGLQQYIY
jgi:prepilin-type N-terminal cleavage/methylation domain-containing protein